MVTKVQRFEDLIALQRVREPARAVHAATRPGPTGRNPGFCTRTRRAAVSIMSSIAEGSGRRRLTEFHQFLPPARSPRGEVRARLCIAPEARHRSEPACNEPRSLAEEVGGIIGGLRTAVARKRKNQRVDK
jgi:four helix bundle protein